jgi:transmembrane 9 superfamily protein 2/4
VKVNAITSFESELPYSYYSLPFCKPEEGVRKTAENLGELLIGDQIENSPYKFQMNENQTHVKVCVHPALTEHDVKLLSQRIDDYYQVNLILDNLPVSRYTWASDNQPLRWIGSPIGWKSADSQYYLYNHLQFKVLIHKYDMEAGMATILGTGDGVDAGTAGPDKSLEGRFMVVGFEVNPCSIIRDAQAADSVPNYQHLSEAQCNLEGHHQPIKVGERIVYSYDVEYDLSDIRWPSRWDAYLKMGNARVHWFSILNSLMVISFLAGIVFVIFLRTVRRDLTKYEELDKEAQAQMTEELSGWKLVVGDVFRAPQCSELLCIVVGDCDNCVCSSGINVTCIARNAVDRHGVVVSLPWHHCRLCGCKVVACFERKHCRLEINCMESGMLLPRHCLHDPHSAEFHSVGK